VRNMLNVRGKTGNFSWLSLAAKGLGSGWIVWQQRPSRLAQLQEEMMGSTGNLIGQRDELQPAGVAGGSVTVPSVLCFVLMCLEARVQLSQQLLGCHGSSAGDCSGHIGCLGLSLRPPCPWCGLELKGSFKQAVTVFPEVTRNGKGRADRSLPLPLLPGLVRSPECV